MILRLLILLFLLSYDLPGRANSLPIKNVFYGVNSDFAMPMAEIQNPLQNPVLQRGIFKDIGEAITAELKVKPTWILLPKKRIGPALVNGDISIICHLHELWQPHFKDQIIWSHEIYKSSNVVVFKKNKRYLRKLKDLYGQRLGAIDSFIYKNLDEHFGSGMIFRENEVSIDRNLQKLLHDRIDYIVMSNFEYQYFKKSYHELESADVIGDHINVKCALSKKSDIKLEQLNSAIDNIKRNGTLDRILNSY